MIFLLFLFLFTHALNCQEITDFKNELSEKSANIPDSKINTSTLELENRTEIKVPQEEKIILEDKNIVPDIEQYNSEIKTTEELDENQFPKGKLELLDKIEAEIVTSTPESTDVQIITTSDIKKRGFDGGKYTLDDLVNEALADNLGKVFKISLTDDDVNKYLKRANLTDKKQLKNLTETWGYESLEDFYENFKKIYRANSALNYEMSSQLVVLENEIQDYYQQNPVYKEANYVIETTFVLLDSTKTKDELKKELEEFANGTKKLDYIIWDPAISVKKSEISNASRFLEDMKVGSIYIKEMSDGFDLFKLINKQPDFIVPFEERKNEIIQKLQAKKHEDAYKKVQNNLYSKAIIYKPDQEVPVNVKQLGL